MNDEALLCACRTWTGSLKRSPLPRGLPLSFISMAVVNKQKRNKSQQVKCHKWVLSIEKCICHCQLCRKKCHKHSRLSLTDFNFIRHEWFFCHDGPQQTQNPQRPLLYYIRWERKSYVCVREGKFLFSKKMHIKGESRFFPTVEVKSNVIHLDRESAYFWGVDFYMIKKKELRVFTQMKLNESILS